QLQSSFDSDNALDKLFLVKLVQLGLGESEVNHPTDEEAELLRLTVSDVVGVFGQVEVLTLLLALFTEHVADHEAVGAAGVSLGSVLDEGVAYDELVDTVINVPTRGLNLFGVNSISGQQAL